MRMVMTSFCESACNYDLVAYNSSGVSSSNNRSACSNLTRKKPHKVVKMKCEPFSFQFDSFKVGLFAKEHCVRGNVEGFKWLIVIALVLLVDTLVHNVEAFGEVFNKILVLFN